jgi:hypothetical protein
MPTYNWKRFWCRRGDPVDLSDGGYLRDPDAIRFLNLDSNLVTSDALTNMPCLVLLGEPGIGKSTALADFKHRYCQI